MHVVKVGFVCPLRTPLRLNCIAAATSTDWSKTSVLFRVLTLKKSRWNLSQALKKQLRSTVLAVSHLFIGQKVDKASVFGIQADKKQGLFCRVAGTEERKDIWMA